MSAPLTGFEQTGTWTTLAEELAFLTQIAAETDASLSTVGQTVQGLPIYRFDLGAGPHTMLIVALQHAGEPAGREAALRLVRDLAYSTDPDDLAYLATHRIVLLPSVNADMAFSGRDNSVGANLNRDWFKLEQPETRAAMAVLRDVDPQVIVDLHESGADHEQWVGGTEAIAGSYAPMDVLADDLFDAAVAGVIAGGHTAGPYPRNLTPVSGLTTVAGAFHSIGLLSEPMIYDRPGWEVLPLTQRVAVSYSLVVAARQWHAENSAALAAMKADSRHYANTTTDPLPIVTTEMVNGPRVIIDASGYRLGEPLPAHVVDLHDITVEGSFVPLNQPARIAVAMLCDPESRDRIVTAARVPWPVPTMPFPAGEWVDTFVMVDGRALPVTKAWHVVNGERIAIKLPGR